MGTLLDRRAAQKMSTPLCEVSGEWKRSKLSRLARQVKSVFVFRPFQEKADDLKRRRLVWIQREDLCVCVCVAVLNPRQP